MPILPLFWNMKKAALVVLLNTAIFIIHYPWSAVSASELWSLLTNRTNIIHRQNTLGEIFIF